MISCKASRSISPYSLMRCSYSVNIQPFRDAAENFQVGLRGVYVIAPVPPLAVAIVADALIDHQSQIAVHLHVASRALVFHPLGEEARLRSAPEHRRQQDL